MNTCLNCKHAKWTMTKNGRRNPRAIGECTWTKTVQVPLSYSYTPTTINGGYIWPQSVHAKCPVFHPIHD